MKTLLFIGLLALLFSSYFIAGYFFSVNSFAQTPAILGNLDTIFFKDVSLESAIAFVREDQASNSSVMAVESESVSGADYYLGIAEQREFDYLELRRNIPSLFLEIKSYLDRIETAELCAIANKGTNIL